MTEEMCKCGHFRKYHCNGKCHADGKNCKCKEFIPKTKQKKKQNKKCHTK